MSIIQLCKKIESKKFNLSLCDVTLSVELHCKLHEKLHRVTGPYVTITFKLQLTPNMIVCMRYI